MAIPLYAVSRVAKTRDEKIGGDAINMMPDGSGPRIEYGQHGGRPRITPSVMVLGSELNGQPDITIRLNARYLIETLGVLESDEVRIQCMNADSPVMIEEGSAVAVINRLLTVT